MPRYSGTSSYTAYVMYSSDLYYRRGANHGTGNVVKDNVMSNGVSTTAGPYYGVADYRCCTQSDGNIVSNNTISDVYYAGIYNYYASNFEATNNTINFRSRTSYTCYGIYGYRGAGDKVKINGNKIENQNISSGMYGIYLYYVSGNSSSPVQVKNNKIDKININADRDFCGFYINRDNNIDVTGNTVSNVVTRATRHIVMLMGFMCIMLTM